MNKKAFMEELERRLKHLPKEDREDALCYYEEYLTDMDVEENADVTQTIGSPKDIAREIIVNCTEKHMDAQKEQGGVKNSATVIWMVILGICAAPLAIPLAVAFIMILFALLLVVVALVLSVLLAGAGFVSVGVVSLISTIWATGVAQGMICIGFGLVGIAVGVLCLVAGIKLAELMTRGIANLFKRIFVRKKVA